MTILEDRLKAALGARADQIGESDLRPAVLPEAKRRPRVVWVLAAAAMVTGLIAVPYGFTRFDPEVAPAPPAATPTVPSGLGADWPMVAVGAVDLDGDGTAETVRLRQADDTGGPLRVEVALSGGEVYAVREGEAPGYRLEDPVDVDGSGGEEVLVSAGTSLAVFGLVDGKLVELNPPVEPPMVRRTDGQGRSVTWTVEEGRLFSLRSVEPVDAGSAEKYLVERWRWGIDGSALVPERVQDRCVDPAEPEKAVSCTPKAPALFEQRYPALWSEDGAMPLAFEVEGSPATARLVYAPDYGAGDWISDGDVELVVTTSASTWRIDVPAGPLPSLAEQAVTISPAGDQGIVVLQQGIGFDIWNVFGFQGDDLMLLELPRLPDDLITGEEPPGGWDPYLGGGYDAEGRPVNWTMETWIQGGWTYTSRKVTGTDERDVYRWDRSGDALTPTLLGRFCFDQDDTGRDC